jgi:hypothetical protein
MLKKFPFALHTFIASLLAYKIGEDLYGLNLSKGGVLLWFDKLTTNGLLGLSNAA